MQITLVCAWRELESTQTEWNALVEQSETNTIFQTFEWHASWFHAFGNRCEPFILVVEDENRIVGIAPFVRVTRCFWGHTRRVIEFVGTNTSGYCNLIVKRADTQVRALILDWLAEHRSEWDALDWTDIPETSATLREAETFFRERRFKTHTRVLYPVAVRVLENSFADRAVINTRSLRWHRHRLNRKGNFRFRCLTKFAEMAPYLDLLFDLHIRRRQITAMPSFFLDDAYRVFYKTMVQALSEQGHVFFFIELLDQTPLALGICIEYDRRLFVYQFTFDLNFGKFSPGTLLAMDMLGFALQRGAIEFDLGAGDQPYKYRIANRTRTNSALRVCQYSTDYYVMRLIVGLKLLVNRSPHMLALARRITEILNISQPVSKLN